MFFSRSECLQVAGPRWILRQIICVRVRVVCYFAWKCYVLPEYCFFFLPVMNRAGFHKALIAKTIINTWSLKLDRNHVCLSTRLALYRVSQKKQNGGWGRFWHQHHHIWPGTFYFMSNLSSYGLSHCHFQHLPDFQSFEAR